MLVPSVAIVCWINGSVSRPDGWLASRPHLNLPPDFALDFIAGFGDESGVRRGPA